MSSPAEETQGICCAKWVEPSEKPVVVENCGTGVQDSAGVCRILRQNVRHVEWRVPKFVLRERGVRVLIGVSVQKTTFHFASLDSVRRLTESSCSRRCVVPIRHTGIDNRKRQIIAGAAVPMDRTGC